MFTRIRKLFTPGPSRSELFLLWLRDLTPAITELVQRTEPRRDVLARRYFRAVLAGGVADALRKYSEVTLLMAERDLSVFRRRRDQRDAHRDHLASFEQMAEVHMATVRHEAARRAAAAACEYKEPPAAPETDEGRHCTCPDCGRSPDLAEVLVPVGG